MMPSNCRRKYRKACNSSREDYREAFVLFHEQGLSWSQISDAMGRPLGTVKTWIHRGSCSGLVEYLIQRDVLPENEHVVRAV